MKIQHSVATFGDLNLLAHAQRLYFPICGDFHQHAAPYSSYNALTEATAFGDFLKQKSRGNHHAIGFYLVKSEQC